MSALIGGDQIRFDRRIKSQGVSLTLDIPDAISFTSSIHEFAHRASGGGYNKISNKTKQANHSK